MDIKCIYRYTQRLGPIEYIDLVSICKHPTEMVNVSVTNIKNPLVCYDCKLRRDHPTNK